MDPLAIMKHTSENLFLPQIYTKGGSNKVIQILLLELFPTDDIAEGFWKFTKNSEPKMQHNSC